MGAAIDSFLAGAPVLLAHLAVTGGMLATGVAFYMWTTAHDELALIRAGNSAAAVSLGAAILGLALPLAVCMANSVSVYDIVIWGVLTLFIQIAVFWILDHWLKNLPARIEAGEMGAATLLSAVKLSVAMINAAAVSG